MDEMVFALFVKSTSDIRLTSTLFEFVMLQVYTLPMQVGEIHQEVTILLLCTFPYMMRVLVHQERGCIKLCNLYF